MDRLDKMTIIGLVAILLTVLYVLAVGNILHMLFNPLALIIVYGGTFSATFIAYPWSVIKEIVPSLKILLFPSKHSDKDMEDKIDYLALLAEKAPIFGLLGTLMGIVEMLRNMSNPASMGAAMSNAVTATFYGIFSANVFIPIATKLTDHSERDIISKEMVAEGILAIQQGDVPLIVRKKLTAFIMAHMRQK